VKINIFFTAIIVIFCGYETWSPEAETELEFWGNRILKGILDQKLLK